MNPKLRNNLVKALKAIRFDSDGSPSKGLIVDTGTMPYPDVIGYEENEDTIVLKVQVFQEEKNDNEHNPPDDDTVDFPTSTGTAD